MPKQSCSHTGDIVAQQEDNVYPHKCLPCFQSLKCSKWLAGTSQTSWSPLWAGSTSSCLCSWASCTANLLPACKIISLQGLGLLFAINIQKQDDFQTFLCFKILMCSLSFDFLYIITKTPQFSFLKDSYLDKTTQTLSFNFFYLLPIV